MLAEVLCIRASLGYHVRAALGWALGQGCPPQLRGALALPHVVTVACLLAGSLQLAASQKLGSGG